jgi:hypothetical protein
MAEKKVIELEVKTDSVKSLKTQLREAQAEVAALSEKFGATSREAINAAKRAAELKDAIGDAKALTDAYNPDAKFNALSQALSGVLNGFQAFEGALGLIGVESKEVQEQLLKVQSAMALAQGVSGVMESIDSFRTLGAQIKNLTIFQRLSTAAQWLWNAAMSANPLGAILLAITAVIVAGYKLISFFQESAAENERMAKSIDKHAAALKKQQQQIESSATKQAEYNKFQYDYAKASGASAEELRKLAIRHQNEQIALANKNKELAKSTYLREQDILATMTANDADEELIEKQKEIVKQARENATKARESAVQENKDLIDLKRQQSVELRQEQTDANKKASEDAKVNGKKAADKAREKWEKEKELSKKNNEELSALLQNHTKKEDEIITQSFLSKEEWQEKWNEQTKKLEEEQFKDSVGYLEADIIANENNFKAKLDLLELQRKKELENVELTEGEKAAIEAKYAKQKKDLETQSLKFSQMNQGQKLELVLKYAQTFSQAMGSLTTLLNANDNERLKNVKKGSKEEEAIKKKMFERDKKLRIVQTVIDTASNVVNSVRNGGGVPVGIPFGVAAAAMGAMQIAAISKAKFEGGGEQVQSPTGGTTGGAVAPSFNIVGNAQATNPLAGLGSSPIKAYVVSGEVTTAQSLDRQKVYSATFG